jgi:hypothetical protein
VLLFAVLTCVPDDAAQKNLLAEFKRILRPRGLFPRGLLRIDLEVRTMNGNPARIVQLWCHKSA